MANKRQSSLVTAGAKLLAAVIIHDDVATFRDIDPDLLFSDSKDEKRLYRFVERHFRRYNRLPSLDVVAEHTGYLIPDQASENAKYYLRRCRQRSFVRRLAEPTQRLQQALMTPRQSADDLEYIIDELYAIKNQVIATGSGEELTSTLIHATKKDSIEARKYIGILRGVTTGFDLLDREVDGYQRDDLVVWVGRPGRGKSWFLLKQAYAAWVAGHKPLYISMEMGAKQNMRRLLSFHTGVNPNLIRKGMIGTSAWRMFEDRVNGLLDLRPMPIVTSNFSRTVDQVANFIDKHSPDIVFIDAGYLLSPKKKRYGSSGRRETISDVIEELKQLAGDAGIPFVITVQFNRSSEQRRRGAVARMREGATVESPVAHLSLAEIGETDVIGQAASHVIGLDYPPPTLPQTQYRAIGFLKGREGESGWWFSTYPKTSTSPVAIDLLPHSHPVYEEYLRSTNNNQRQRGQRPSAAMRIQD